MEVAEAHEFLRTRLDIDPQRFYFVPARNPLGAGELYDGVRFAAYNRVDSVFDTLEGRCYVLTHECDVDAGNERLFNYSVLVCPIIDFDSWVEEYQEELGEERLKDTLGRLANREIFRVMYLPPLPPVLPHGGLMYFNEITHTHSDWFQTATPRFLASVTSYGLTKIDQMLQNVLFRPKAVQLA